MSKHDTGFIKILVLLFGLGIIQITNSGCIRWKQEPATNQINSKQVSAIFGGTKVFETELLAKKIFYLAINSKLLKTPLGYAARQDSFCTAIAMTTSIVLTAAHCVENILPEKINLIEGVSPWLSPLKPELWHQSKHVFIHPKYKKNHPEYDIALIQLNSALTIESLTSLADSDPSELVVTLAGYGFRINTIHSGQSVQAAGNDLLKNNSGELFYITKNLTEFSQNQLTFFFEKSLTETVCIGDSGGPAMIFDQDSQTYKAIGLLSGSAESARSQSHAEFEDYDFCSETPVYNNLMHPEIRDWIDRSTSQLTNQLLDSN